MGSRTEEQTNMFVVDELAVKLALDPGCFAHHQLNSVSVWWSWRNCSWTAVTYTVQ